MAPERFYSSIDEEIVIERLDKAPRLSISILIWILSSDTICQLNQFHTNSKAATQRGCCVRGQRLSNNLDKVVALVALVKLSILFVTGLRIWPENL